MKSNLILIISSLLTLLSCNLNDDADINSFDLYLNKENIYVIKTDVGKAHFERLFEEDPSVKCILAYTDKIALIDAYIPWPKESIIGLDLPECLLINDHLFSKNTSLISINLPECRVINTKAFAYCVSLTEINIPKCIIIEEGAFSNIGGTSEQPIVLNLPVCTKIDNYAFQNWRALSAINLAECTEVGIEAFQDCVNLKTANLPKCETILKNAFANNSSLTKVNLPVCTTIGVNAFSECMNLMQLSLFSLEDIDINSASAGDGAFFGVPTGRIALSLNPLGEEYVKANPEDKTWDGKTWREINTTALNF